MTRAASLQLFIRFIVFFRAAANALPCRGRASLSPSCCDHRHRRPLPQEEVSAPTSQTINVQLSQRGRGEDGVAVPVAGPGGGGPVAAVVSYRERRMNAGLHAQRRLTCAIRPPWRQCATSNPSTIHSFISGFFPLFIPPTTRNGTEHGTRLSRQRHATTTARLHHTARAWCAHESRRGCGACCSLTCLPASLYSTSSTAASRACRSPPTRAGSSRS